MRDMFEEVFMEVAEEHDAEAWYEVFDSDLFDIVCDRISARLGHDCQDDDEFVEWESEMAMDL